MTAWIVFLCTLVGNLFLIPLVRRFSLRIGKLSQPRDDRWHHQPTPTLGGIGIFLSFGLCLGIVLLVSLFPGSMSNEVRGLAQGGLLNRWGLLIGAVIVFGLGLYDDLKRLSPQTKLVGQILATTVIIALGYTTRFFTPQISNSLIAQIPNILLTYIWMIGITNAINLLDNMDGLAGGISLITAGILSFLFWRAGNLNLFMFSMALTGSILGFLFYNFPPASIFMGDSGSQFLGFTLAALAIARQPQASNVFAVIGVPTLLFLLPILDTTLVTVTRLLRGQSPAQGGRDHASHRLIAFGLTERQAVLALYGVALLAGLAAIGIEALRSINSVSYSLSLVFVPVLVIALALVTAYLGRFKMVTNTTAGNQPTFTRIILDLTYRRRLLEVILDFFLIAVACYLAFLIRYGLVLKENHLALYLQTLPVALVAGYLSMFLIGVYRGIWRYVGVDDWLRYAWAAMISVILTWIGTTYLMRITPLVSEFVFLFFGIFLFLGLAISRSSFRIMDLISGKRTKEAEERVLIFGAGDTGEMALRWIMMNPQLKYRPVGFVDDDPLVLGRQIHGVEVLGNLDQLEAILQRKQIHGVIYAGISDTPTLNQLVARCAVHSCWVKRLHLEFELLEVDND